MNPLNISLLIVSYFAVLIGISYLTSRKENNDAFFTGNKQSPWYVVAFGMIGASLSGVTFISVPGWVEASQFSYLQMVIGYFFGYMVIILVLLPLYYRMNLISIYEYLGDRFGKKSYKTGAWLFLISKVIGAAFRLFLVANVLQLLIFDHIGVPFFVTVALTIVLILLYTFKSGIKTIIWTDTLQTFFMLAAVFVVIMLIMDKMEIPYTDFFDHIFENGYSKTFFFEDTSSPDYFWKQFLSGAFIAIVMTGLDQDMMQKNLSVKTVKDSQKNMFWMSISLVFVNFFFLAVGVLLIEYANINGIDAHGDDLFPVIATQTNLGPVAATFFVLGLIAAAYSSADSALTSLTTSFSVDILEVEKMEAKKAVKTRKAVHISMSLILMAVIILFGYVIEESVIKELFIFAGYTYGPLLGIYTFGLFTKIKVNDKFIPYVAIAAPIISYIVKDNSYEWFGYNFGFELLIFNGMITFIGLLLFRKKK
ncbi:MAG: sodium:solute symporter [Bacteroidota bacterium]